MPLTLLTLTVMLHEQVEISRNYGMYEWREDLKYICKKAGSENKPSVFLFSDTQVRRPCIEVKLRSLAFRRLIKLDMPCI